MSDAKQVIVGGVPVLIKDEAARNSIGNLSNLNTAHKNNLVAAINEAAQSGSSANAVQYTAQTLTTLQKAQARTNIGAGQSDFSGDYNDLSNKPSIPTVPTISTDISADATSDTKTASPKAVKTYVDANAGSPDAVKYTSQSLTSEQQAQARTNIGAGTSNFIGDPIVQLSVPSTADGTLIATLSSGDTFTINLNHNHPEYYSKNLGGSQPAGGFLPDVAYKLGTISGTITFALASAVTGRVNHYYWTFDSSSTAPTITWPASVTKWTGNCVTSNAPVISASMHYEVSILDGVGFIYES